VDDLRGAAAIGEVGSSPSRTPKVPVAATVTRSNAGLTPQRRSALAPPYVSLMP
jgi:hypothetical protein